MAEFIVVGFEGSSTAEKVTDELRDSGDLDLNIEASAVISRNEDGEVNVTTPENDRNEEVQATVAGSFAGGGIGLLVGALIGNPAIGLVAGSTLGGLAGAGAGNLDQLGIDSQFNQEIGQLLEKNSSAICFLFWDQSWDELAGQGVEKIRNAGGSIIKTTLAVADENELKSILQ